ncbi:aldolase/citrate lyase family protein [Comamonadaceae bacterium SL12-8]|uniref:Aldolase/citrate lyase family protein n=1 Tax=Amphibiibacter pelophylacis TaxID=1799477 RepID=A0ACC6P2P1_9BURK
MSPDLALLGRPARRRLPVCDHYAGVEARMRKSLELQARMGPVFDVTLDLEDGAPVGQEMAHCDLIHELLASPDNVHGRVGVRVHPVDHPMFRPELRALLRYHAGRTHPLAYLMVPKLRHLHDAQEACSAIHHAALEADYPHPIPVQVLIETHGALIDVFDIAALPEIESLSFGLMDFVSDHDGAIPADALTAEGQFSHPLVCRAKTRIAAAAHAHGKVPSHCVVTELNQQGVLASAVQRARHQFAYTRMWSIHPSQIPVILAAYTPSQDEVDEAVALLSAAQDAQWGPIRHADRLHDRASYRYFWSLLQRARQTGLALPQEALKRFFSQG